MASDGGQPTAEDVTTIVTTARETGAIRESSHGTNKNEKDKMLKKLLNIYRNINRNVNL